MTAFDANSNAGNNKKRGDARRHLRVSVPYPLPFTPTAISQR